MITVAGTVFSVTIASVVFASGQYGPRLLSNFMSDRGNQVTLGAFIATFVYCLLGPRPRRPPAGFDRRRRRRLNGPMFSRPTFRRFRHHGGSLLAGS